MCANQRKRALSQVRDKLPCHKNINPFLSPAPVLDWKAGLVEDPAKPQKRPRYVRKFDLQ